MTATESTWWLYLLDCDGRLYTGISTNPERRYQEHLAGGAKGARFTRSAMLEVLGQPYIRTASAKGLLWRDVVRTHALPNAAIPTLTIIGFLVGSLVAGAVVVESVFSWPGVGRLLVNAVANRDLAVVQVILLLVGLTMVGANLAVDILYGMVDPRLRIKRLKAGS